MTIENQTKSDLLLVESDAGVYTVTINRPKQRNALNPELLGQLTDTFRGFADNPDVRVVVLRGAGEQAFSAGYDIGSLPDRALTGADERRGEVAKPNEFSLRSNPFQTVIHAVSECQVPTIALVYGYAYGGGSELAATCDIRICAENAKFASVPAKLGVVYGPAGLQVFINLIGLSRAKYMFFSGRPFDARKCLEMGLADEVLPLDEVESFTYALAHEIADNAPLSIRGSKFIFNKLVAKHSLDEAELDECELLQARAYSSEDLGEGRRAFAEKRKPVFQGR
ncbi:MAG: enoyl-CoA hydratase/isomerase family protein [Chloroflexi bacterium]|nr:enoyl-CoA hydratase/isomerase family protein [Chloroflexota bacterium]